MAITTVKPLYLDSNGVYRPVSSDATNGNKIAVAELQVTKDAVANKTLVMDSSGNLSPALISNANVDSSAAIAGSKIDASSLSSIPAGNLTGTIAAISGENLTSLNASNLSSGTVPDNRFPATLPAVSGANLTSLNASNISSGTLNDSRLSNNVALKSYVDAVAAGIDYKQQADYYGYFEGSGLDKSTLLTLINTGVTFDGYTYGPITGEFTAGNTFLLLLGNSDDGLYTLSGSDGSWALTNRTSDMPVGSHARGAYTYCFKKMLIDGMVTHTVTFPTFNTAVICTNSSSSDLVGTNSLTFVTFSSGAAYSAGDGISVVSNVISVNYASGLDIGTGGNAGKLIAKVDNSTIQINGSSQIALKSLPSNFKINGSAVSNNVTQASLDTLTGGTTSDASSLHIHQTATSVHANGGSLSVGAAVYFDGSDVVVGTKLNGKVIGVIGATSGGYAAVATAGEVQIFSPAGSPTWGDNLYLGASGGLCTYATLSSGDYATKVGKYLGPIGPGSAHMLAIAIQEFGIKP